MLPQKKYTVFQGQQLSFESQEPVKLIAIHLYVYKYTSCTVTIIAMKKYDSHPNNGTTFKQKETEKASEKNPTGF